MFASNPFATLPETITPAMMQGYIVLMVLLVMGGTILDMLHKKSAKYFFENAKKAQKSAKRSLSGGEKFGLAVSVLTHEILTAGEFSNVQRRISHLFMMYGFVLFVLSTALLAFNPGTDSALLPQLWHVGALMLAVGAYWFWFAIRVDVAAEGLPVFRIERADLFILSLIATSTFALLWSFNGGGLNLLFVLFIVSATVLFGGVYWSKFAHMFFKPAAAYQKKTILADGSRENLPSDFDPRDPEVQRRYPDLPKYMGKNPPNMGLCINAEKPRHY